VGPVGTEQPRRFLVEAAGDPLHVRATEHGRRRGEHGAPVPEFAAVVEDDRALRADVTDRRQGAARLEEAHVRLDQLLADPGHFPQPHRVRVIAQQEHHEDDVDHETLVPARLLDAHAVRPDLTRQLGRELARRALQPPAGLPELRQTAENVLDAFKVQG
jgi:hypothetical protein